MTRHKHSAAAADRVTGVERARRVVETMVQPGGCAWHEGQTHESLTKYAIEEAYELADAIEQGDPERIAEELGDVLYQVLFHAALSERDGEGYDLDRVGEALADKLIARHPHVFGDRGYMTVEELHAEWERLKEDAQGQARGTRSPLAGIPMGMSPLARSAKVVERLKRAHLLEPRGDEIDEASLGEALLALVERANANGLDPERALRRATDRLIERLGVRDGVEE